MKWMKLAFVTALICSPLTAQADMLLTNKSSAPATAIAGLSPCSNIAGNKGIAQPHSTLTVPQAVLDVYCPSSCEASIYMSKNCSGHRIAIITANKTKGVTKIVNLGVKGYEVHGGGMNLDVTGA